MLKPTPTQTNSEISDAQALETRKGSMAPRKMLRDMMLPRGVLSARATSPRGSVLILVVAVLVLLALMGTAYITSSRADKQAATASGTIASVDTLATGVLEKIKTNLAADKLDTTKLSYTAVDQVNQGTVSGARIGLLPLSPRVPVAPGGTTAHGEEIPRWPYLSAPLNATSTVAGEFYSPLVAPVVAGTFLASPLGSTYTVQSLTTFPTWGVTEQGRRGPLGPMTDPSSTPLPGVTIGAIALNGIQYPAFYVVEDRNLNGTIDAGEASFVLAADADGDGIADSGYSYLGTLGNPAYSGVTFYAGYRVIDNNSAINANTALTNGPDLATGTGGGAVAVRNNRLFPGAVGLAQSLTRPAPNHWGNSGNNPYDLIINRPSPDLGKDLVGYLSEGKMTASAKPRATVVGDMPLGTMAGRGQASERTDYQFQTLHELMWMQMDRRLEVPGFVPDTSGTTYTQFVPFRPFSLGDQMALTNRFVLPIRNPGDDFLTALGKQSPLEQTLAFSLYRVGGNTNASTQYDWSTVASYPLMSTIPYTPAEYGSQTNTPVETAAPTAPRSWFVDNFNYETKPTAAEDYVTVRNLRPLLVTRNGVSQNTLFKPLPEAAVLPLSVFPTGQVPAFDAMTPYVDVWNANAVYAPGDMVFYNATATPSAPSGSAIDPARLYVNSTSTTLTGSSQKPGTLGVGWTLVKEAVMPTAVNVNTASFGELWRGYYCAMSGPSIDPTNATDYVYLGTPLYKGTTTDSTGNTQGTLTTNNTISPFGLPVRYTTTAVPYTPQADVLTPAAEAWRGMGYSPVPANASTTSDDATTDTYFSDDVPSVSTAELATATANTVGGAQTTYHPQRMFRSKLKDPTGSAAITPENMVLLRAAQSAVNAEYLRSLNSTRTNAGTVYHDDVVRRTIPLRIYFGAGTASPNIETEIAQVYSHSRHPYITEMYASTALTGTGAGYVAIELYNPYPFAISLQHYRLEAMTRSAASMTTVPTARKVLWEFGDAAFAPVIQPGQTLVIDNYQSGGRDETHGNLAAIDPSLVGLTGTTSTAPGAGTSALTPSGPGPTATYIYVKTLGALLDASNTRELLLCRPMFADYDTTTAPYVLRGVGHTASSDPRVAAVYDAATVGKEAADYYAPVDSVDLYGVLPAPTKTDDSVTWPAVGGANGTGTPKTRHRAYGYDYHYARDGGDWKFVYPGRYLGSNAGVRQQGLRQALRRSDYTVSPYTAGVDKAPPTDVALFTNPAPSFGTVNTAASYDQTQPIQIANVGFGGFNAQMEPGAVNRYPFGGLARELDILQIPFISPVRIRTNALMTVGAETYIDIISMTSDASFAEDTDTNDNGEENIGRPTPIVGVQPLTVDPHTLAAPNFFFSYVDIPTRNYIPYIDEFNVNTQFQRYGWANRLLDYLTVRGAAGQTLPSTSLARTTSSDGTVDAASGFNVANYPQGSAPVAGANIPQPVAPKSASFTTLNTRGSAGAGVEGLVNVNTAPLPVLAAIPWTQSTSDNDTAARLKNIAIAKAIIHYRETVGPFHSIFEVNRVRMVSDAGVLQTSTLRSGGITNTTSPVATWATAMDASQTVTDDPMIGQITHRMHLETARSGSTADSILIRSNFNGDFSPMYNVTAADRTISGGNRVQLYPRDANLNGSAGSPDTTPDADQAYPGDFAQPVLGASDLTNGVGLRNPDGDFEAQYLMLNAVSNLITTKSDTFTAYIVIEGWENAGQPTARRVLQRRYSYILDRSEVGNFLPALPVNGSVPVGGVAGTATNASAVITTKTPTINANVRVLPVQIQVQP